MMGMGMSILNMEMNLSMFILPGLKAVLASNVYARRQQGRRLWKLRQTSVRKFFEYPSGGIDLSSGAFTIMWRLAHHISQVAITAVPVLLFFWSS
jgi:hypothetical protein